MKELETAQLQKTKKLHYFLRRKVYADFFDHFLKNISASPRWEHAKKTVFLTICELSVKAK